MVKIRKYLVSSALAFSAVAFGQGSVSHYPQMYENSAVSVSSTSEKSILTAKEQIDININNMMSDPVLRNANWGFVVYDPKTKKVISSYNESTPLIPASTTKLLTTETALNLLGDKFRWITQLEHSGEIDANGNLNGNLYIIGSGDPSLGTGKAGAYSYREIITDFITAMSEQGIKKVNGDIIIQTAVFKNNKNLQLPENIVWLENNNYYIPVGHTQNIDPRNEKLIVKQASPFSTDKRYFYVSPYINQVVFSENFSQNSVDTKLPDAPAYLANSLRTSLIKSGLPVTGKVVTKTVIPNPEKTEKITSYSSPTLAEIIYYTNQHSDNALAEATVRMVGFQKKGDQTLESGRIAVMEHLKNKFFDTNGLNYMDGSGLSKSNTVTPIAQVKFLSSLMTENYFKDYFDSLPIAGQSGTLKKMFLNGESYGQIFAKTGTLNKVKCLAGYIKTKTGKTLAFSLLVNNYAGSVDQVKSKMEQLLEPTLNL